MEQFLNNIPRWLSSKVSIFIYIFLFLYLVIFPAVCALVPAMAGFMPSNMTQLILGNYTNVLSALGASIAAGTGVAIHSKVRANQQRHEALQASVDELHKKVDDLMERQ